ncbi:MULTISPECIES: hypothetical protein [Rhizobium/Agrobacterium group]|uniref:Glycosyltransferase n=1 Tax=Agrobacterium vitis TaxID=373 RepID=A0ABD6HEQ1_AGRVI|nr:MULTISPECIES: hypothetical protein [Rhizobium/Agrobacterium group]MCF1449563.1 hypothetical protein [Allorhizobium ampelinum]MCF1495462.1 hypothetical protein [Allorhizobium ampelinum]MUO28241.1 hypothetical protein [Agrobacterium vitis]MUO40725.1 hypothetical protein [Agrobacterium vitis]MUP12736.1 hypothetical protein [Agrobacterium vitis]
MPKLSVCIPVEPGHILPVNLVQELLKNATADLEIILSGFGDTVHRYGPFADISARDSRLRLLPPAPETLSAAQLWIGTLAAAEGDWVSLVHPEDMIEPDLPELLSSLENKHPHVDALGWSAFQISADAPRHIKTNVAIPVLHNITEFEKAPMLEAFFHWKEARQVPRMPFGLYHGAIKRSLIDSVLSACGALSWLTLVPQYEWAARVLLFANALAFCNRPLSAVHAHPFQPRPVPSALKDFPLHAGIGLTAAIAEVQARVLMELGSEWAGFGEDFVRACMYDCAFEHSTGPFRTKYEAYSRAFLSMPGGQAWVRAFAPPFSATPHEDRQQGLHGKVLLVDRFIGNAVNAQQFYAVARSMMTPIRVIAEPNARASA